MAVKVMESRNVTVECDHVDLVIVKTIDFEAVVAVRIRRGKKDITLWTSGSVEHIPSGAISELDSFKQEV